MSQITIEDLKIRDYTDSIKKFVEKLQELCEIEKDLNIEGFQVTISPIIDSNYKENLYEKPKHKNKSSSL